MKTQKILERVLYFALLAGGLIFCWNNIVEHFKGNTSCQVQQKHITFNDLPTLVVCIEKRQPNDSAWIKGRYKYRNDLWIEARARQGDVTINRVPLEENQWIDILIGLKFRISEIKLSFGGIHKELEGGSKNFINYYRQCYKISNKWNGTGDHNVYKTAFQFAIKCKRDKLIKNDVNGEGKRNCAGHTGIAYVYVTSEENSYGVVERKWFDGMVQNSKGIAFEKEGNFGETRKIIEMTEYHKLHWRCSHESYHECLARRYNDLALRIQLDKSNKSEECQKHCLPFTLPKVGNITMPVCTNRLCYNLASSILENLKFDIYKHCKIACGVKEYVFGGSDRLKSEPSDKDSLVFEYGFASPSSTNSHRYQVPFKVVKTEYEVFPFISLIGVVGGTLGMFVGISFMGIAELLITAFSVKLHYLRILQNSAKSG